MTTTTQRLKPTQSASVHNSSDNSPIVVLCSSKDDYLLSQDICTLCGSLGKAEEGNLISCSQCGQCYHPFCVNIKGLKVVLSKGWRCLECTVCEVCGQPGDEAKLMLCDECELSCHTYCLDPPLDAVPKDAWKCNWCVMCQKCGSHTSGINSQWEKNYTECGPCSSRSACAKCKIEYVEKDLILQCLHCSRWLHARCDSIRDEDECELAIELGYTCLLCRPKDEIPLYIIHRKLNSNKNHLDISPTSTPTITNHQQDCREDHQNNLKNHDNIEQQQKTFSTSNNNDIRSKYLQTESPRPQSAPLTSSSELNNASDSIKRPSSSLHFSSNNIIEKVADNESFKHDLTNNIDDNKIDGKPTDDPFQGLHLVDGVYLTETGFNFMKSLKLKPAKRQKSKKPTKVQKLDDCNMEDINRDDDEENKLMSDDKADAHSSDLDLISQTKKIAAIIDWEPDEALGDKATKSAVLYANIEHPTLKQRYKNSEERFRQINKLWRQLPLEKRKPYNERARENRAASKVSSKPSVGEIASINKDESQQITPNQQQANPQIPDGSIIVQQQQQQMHINLPTMVDQSQDIRPISTEEQQIQQPTRFMPSPLSHRQPAQIVHDVPICQPPDVMSPTVRTMSDVNNHYDHVAPQMIAPHQASSPHPQFTRPPSQQQQSMIQVSNVRPPSIDLNRMQNSDSYSIPPSTPRPIQIQQRSPFSPHSPFTQHPPNQASSTPPVSARTPSDHQVIYQSPGPQQMQQNQQPGFIQPQPQQHQNIMQQQPISDPNWQAQSSDIDLLTQTKKNVHELESDEALGDRATKSAYLYANIEHPSLKQEYKNPVERLKQINKLWRQLPQEKRKPYNEKARENRAASKVSSKPVGAESTNISKEEPQQQQQILSNQHQANSQMPHENIIMQQQNNMNLQTIVHQPHDTHWKEPMPIEEPIQQPARFLPSPQSHRPPPTQIVHDSVPICQPPDVMSPSIRTMNDVNNHYDHGTQQIITPHQASSPHPQFTRPPSQQQSMIQVSRVRPPSIDPNRMQNSDPYAIPPSTPRPLPIQQRSPFSPHSPFTQHPTNPASSTPPVSARTPSDHQIIYQSPGPQQMQQNQQPGFIQPQQHQTHMQQPANQYQQIRQPHYNGPPHQRMANTMHQPPPPQFSNQTPNQGPVMRRAVNPQVHPQMIQQQGASTYQPQPAQQYRQLQPVRYSNQQHQEVHPHVNSPMQQNLSPQHIHQQRIQSPGMVNRQMVPQNVGVPHQPPQRMMINQPTRQQHPHMTQGQQIPMQHHQQSQPQQQLPPPPQQQQQQLVTHSPITQQQQNIPQQQNIQQPQMQINVQQHQQGPPQPSQNQQQMSQMQYSIIPNNKCIELDDPIQLLGEDDDDLEDLGADFNILEYADPEPDKSASTSAGKNNIELDAELEDYFDERGTLDEKRSGDQIIQSNSQQQNVQQHNQVMYNPMVQQQQQQQHPGQLSQTQTYDNQQNHMTMQQQPNIQQNQYSPQRQPHYQQRLVQPSNNQQQYYQNQPMLRNQQQQIRMQHPQQQHMSYQQQQQQLRPRYQNQTVVSQEMHQSQVQPQQQTMIAPQSINHIQNQGPQSHNIQQTQQYHSQTGFIDGQQQQQQVPVVTIQHQQQYPQQQQQQQQIIYNNQGQQHQQHNPQMNIRRQFPVQHQQQQSQQHYSYQQQQQQQHQNYAPIQASHQQMMKSNDMIMHDKSPIVGDTITSMEFTMFEQGSGANNEAINLPVQTVETSSHTNQERPFGLNSDNPTTSLQSNQSYEHQPPIGVEVNQTGVINLPEPGQTTFNYRPIIQNESIKISHDMSQQTSTSTSIDSGFSFIPATETTNNNNNSSNKNNNNNTSGRLSSCSIGHENNETNNNEKASITSVTINRVPLPSSSTNNNNNIERSTSIPTSSNSQPQNQLLKQLLGNCSSADNPHVVKPPPTKSNATKLKKDALAERRALLEREKTPPPKEIKPKKRVRGPNKKPEDKSSNNKIDGLKPIDSNSNTSDNSQLLDTSIQPPPKKRVRRSRTKQNKDKIEIGEVIGSNLSSLPPKINLNEQPPMLPVKEPEILVNNNVCTIFACGDLNQKSTKLKGTFGKAFPITGLSNFVKKKSGRKPVGYYHEEFPNDLNDITHSYYNNYSMLCNIERDCDSPDSIISGSSSDFEDSFDDSVLGNTGATSRKSKSEWSEIFTPDLDKYMMKYATQEKQNNVSKMDHNNNKRSISPSISIDIKLPVRQMPITALSELDNSDNDKENLSDTNEDQTDQLEDQLEPRSPRTDQASTSLSMRLKDHGNVSVTLTLTNKEADGVKRVLNSLSQLIDYPIQPACVTKCPENDSSPSNINNNENDNHHHKTVEQTDNLSNSFRLLTGTSQNQQVNADNCHRDLKFNEMNYVAVDSFHESKPIMNKTQTSYGPVDVKPEFCCRCKAIVVDCGIRKDITEIPEQTILSMRKLSIIEENQVGQLVFCSVNCYAACILCLNSKSQQQNATSASDKKTSYAAKSVGLPPMSPMMEDDEDDLNSRLDQEHRNNVQDKTPQTEGSTNSSDSSMQKKKWSNIRYTRWTPNYFKQNKSTIISPIIEDDMRDIMMKKENISQSSSQLTNQIDSSIDSNESDSTTYSQSLSSKQINALEESFAVNNHDMLMKKEQEQFTTTSDDTTTEKDLFTSNSTREHIVSIWPEGMSLVQVKPYKLLTQQQIKQEKDETFNLNDDNLPNELYEDTRKCVLCHEFGDGESDGPSRLLNMFVDGWVHLNCALWSLDVFELGNGALMNVELARKKAMTCSSCSRPGATLKCFKLRCPNYYHFLCATKEKCAFYEDKSVQCRQHSKPTTKEMTSFVVRRRVYVNRDEQKQVAEMIQGEQQNVMRIGSLVFLNIGQLLPHQLANFHDNNKIFPVGYKVIRYYWSYRQYNKRCKYLCSIEDNDGKPQFKVIAQEYGFDDELFLGSTPDLVWRPIIDMIVDLRKPVPDTIKTFPAYIRGDDLFGLTEPNIVRILESLPGVETLTDYEFKFGRSPLLELPLAINPTGCARTEPKLRTHFKRPYTIHTASSIPKSRLQSLTSGDNSSPYIKQFVHSKSSQYRKMKSEWRNNVVLARSRVQGLGLYAARDIEKHTMVIEYIGMLIRNEIAERYERIHEAHNRGIYMFRLDEDRVIDATLAGGLARYINHSCNPNCVAEAVEIDRERKILIIANRKILKGEELGYDYKLAIEDEQHKISCLCGALTCKKWMN